MQKLTKQQRYYRKKVKLKNRDFKQYKGKDGKKSIKVTRQQLCVRINEEAWDKLKIMAESAGLSKQDMMTRILMIDLPKYATLIPGFTTTSRYNWPDELISPQNKSIRYKGDSGCKQLNTWVTTTAYKKLQCHSTSERLSKARIVQALILNHRQILPADADRAEEYRKKQEEKRKGLAGTGSMPKKIVVTDTLSNAIRMNSNHEVFHIKGIPIEYWDESELAEAERLWQVHAEN